MTQLLKMAVRSRRAPRTDRVVQDAAVDLATAPDRDAVAAAVGRAVRRLAPHPPPRVALADPGQAATAPATPMDHGRLVPVTAVRSGDGAQVGVLLVDPVTASRARLRPALRAISAQATLAVQRLQLTEEIARRRTERGAAALVEQTTDVVLVIDEQNQIRYASPAARVMFGTSALDDIPLTDLVDPAERRPAAFLLRHVHAADPGSPIGVSRADWTIHARDGRCIQVEVSCRPLRAEDPVSGLVVTLRDVTAQRHLERELTRRVFHDPLTGLPNRRLFSERVNQALATAPAPVGVLLIDLDDFRAVNDGLGHDIGDTVLITVARRIREAVGPGGVAARLGDDEFAALIRDVSTDPPGEVAARIADALADPIPLDGPPVSCSASVGVAVSTTASSAPELLRHADLALGVAKADGRGQWRQYHPSMAGAVADRAALRTELARAVREDALLLDYQPIVALDSGRAVGFEALLRWRHPTRGRLSPDTFIDIAEESGLIVPIGEWVLATAMQVAQRWPVPVPLPQDAPYVSVNVSARQLRSPGFVDTVHRLLAATGLPPHRLVLEMTESVLLRDDEKAWDDLQRLRLHGVRIAIDDFGTGYSALSYLRHAPLDVLKLDRLFIAPLTSSSRQRELVAGIVRLAHGLRLDVVAEGIETSQQRDIMAGIGCAYGQGYLFGRPVADPAAYLS